MTGAGAKRVRRLRAPAAGGVVLWLSLSVPAALAHPGPLDSYGCHPNVAIGDYHCHKGPLAGRSFRSPAEMRHALQENEREEAARERGRERFTPVGR